MDGKPECDLKVAQRIITRLRSAEVPVVQLAVQLTYVYSLVAKGTMTWEDVGVDEDERLRLLERYKNPMIAELRTYLGELRAGHSTRVNASCLYTYLREGFVTLEEVDPTLTQHEVNRYYSKIPSVSPHRGYARFKGVEEDADRVDDPI